MTARGGNTTWKSHCFTTRTIQTTDADGNLPFISGFNRGVRQGAYLGDGGGYFTGFLAGVFLFLAAVFLAAPCSVGSSSLDPILGRTTNQTRNFGDLLKGLASVVLWLPLYGIVIGLPASVASVFFPGLVSCPPIASVLYFCSLTGAFFQALTGDVHQTPAALAHQIAYTERYCGPLLYQAFGLAALMILSILMFQRGAQGAIRGDPSPISDCGLQLSARLCLESGFGRSAGSCWDLSSAEWSPLSSTLGNPASLAAVSFVLSLKRIGYCSGDPLQWLLCARRRRAAFCKQHSGEPPRAPLPVESET